jgi:hypothetical protein
VHKARTKNMRGRLRVAVVLGVCLIAILALPALASATSPTFMSEYPLGITLHSQPSVVGVDVFGAAVNASTAVIKIDGVAQTTFVTKATNAGSWSSSESLVGGVWKTTWTWTAGGSLGIAKATLYCYPSQLTTATHTVTAAFKDTTGTSWTDPIASWSFTIANPTVVVTPPAPPAAFDNSICYSSCHKVGGTAVGYAKDYVDDNAMGPNCVTCHSGGFTPAHGLDGAAAHTTAAAMCETSGCHTGTLQSIHPLCATCHTPTGVKTCATVGCHDTKISGNTVVSHWYTDAGHTATSSTLAGQRYMGTDAAAQAGNLTFLNPTYVWTSTCSDCHSMALNTQHPAGCATCHTDAGTGAGDVLKGGNWNKSCLASGCHTADPNGGVPVSHLVNGQMDYSHTVAASLTALPGGCSAPAGTGSYGGTIYQRTACHYSDIIQEHNRKIESGPGGTVVQTISVTCAQCHSSAQFKALNGTWDGTCNACHDGTVLLNHSIVGTAEYNRVYGLHQAPAYYNSGTTSTQGILIAGTNTMDAHGPLRTAAVPAHPGAYKPIGCAQAFCHQNAYMLPGSGFYGATVCTQCHPANVAPANSPSGTMTVNNGGIFTASTAATINSAITANGGATLSSMAVDPGTGTYGTAVPYSASYAITLSSTVGPQTVRVKYTDSTARVSTFTYMIWKVVGPSTITASVSGGNGTVTPSGGISVAPGANQTFTFVPAATYRVDTLTVDGSPVASPGTSYTFTNVTAPHTVVVTFAPITFASSGFGAASYSAPAGYSTSGANDYVGFETGLTLAMSQALPANSKLTFSTRYDIENGYDFGYVQVSTDGGTTWTNIAGTGTSNTSASDLVNYGNLGNGITGSQPTWTPATFDLSAYAGKTVKIRFDYRCDSGFYGNGTTSGGIGWNVDDVAVGPTGSPIFTDDFSTVKTDWTTATNTPGNIWSY